ncbi:Mu transposase C-terminal domain-containing protein [Streptomyces sp. NPDC047085]|uniref:Mu transposase C-terminal domain-containing protein n=1 Tax=Streptomyces sp. NPDC047085 TaxID=3155140 RepID=UPI0033C73864
MGETPRERDIDLRRASISRLMYLKQQGTYSSEHLRVVADAFGCDKRTVRRWMDNAAENNGVYTPKPRDSFTLTQEMRDAVARYCGNIAAAYRELKKESRLGAEPPSYATFYRAVTTHFTPGFLAGLRKGERARRAFDVHFNRPPGFRNDAWEADHVEASVWVNVNGHRCKPWVTWFVDCTTTVICGLCVSAQTPSQENVLVAARAALQRGGQFGAFGGVPKLVRVDRAKEFLCKSVEAAMGVFGVVRVDLPPYSPEQKGTVEAVNEAVKQMFFVTLPGYTEAPSTSRRTRKNSRTRIDPDEKLLTYEAFIRHLLQWVHEWNYEHVLTKQKRTPAQLWEEDLTPIYDVNPAELHTYTLKDLERPYTINGDGIHWGPRRYIAPFMNGRKGMKVRLRYMPNHLDVIDVYAAKDYTYLGPAILQNAASPEQRAEVRRAARNQASRLRTTLKRVERHRQERFEADTVPTVPRPVHDLTQEQADELLRGQHREEIAREARTDLIPLPDPSPSWQAPSDDHPASRPPSKDHSPQPLAPRLPSPSPSWDASATEPDEDTAHEDTD